jgi:hypothetical protein
MRQTTLQLSREIGIFRGHMNRLTGFSAQPFIQLLWRCGRIAALPRNRHTCFRPMLSHGDWLTEELSDRLPAFERV